MTFLHHETSIHQQSIMLWISGLGSKPKSFLRITFTMRLYIFLVTHRYFSFNYYIFFTNYFLEYSEFKWIYPNRDRYHTKVVSILWMNVPSVRIVSTGLSLNNPFNEKLKVILNIMLKKYVEERLDCFRLYD